MFANGTRRGGHHFSGFKLLTTENFQLSNCLPTDFVANNRIVWILQNPKTYKLAQLVEQSKRLARIATEVQLRNFKKPPKAVDKLSSDS